MKIYSTLGHIVQAEDAVQALQRVALYNKKIGAARQVRTGVVAVNVQEKRFDGDGLLQSYGDPIRVNL